MAVASVRDTGRDLDHCRVLIKKLEDFENDLSVDKGRVDQVSMFAQKLIGGRHSRADEIRHLVAELNERYVGRLIDCEEWRRNGLTCTIAGFQSYPWSELLCRASKEHIRPCWPILTRILL